MDVIANNIANMSTPGFKGENVVFKEYITPGDEDGKTSFVQDAGVSTDYTQGELVHTGSDLDFGINGDGYFVIGAAQGNRYTRGGHFKLDGNGQITTIAGDPLLSEGGTPMVVPLAATKISLNKDGSLYADGDLLGKVKLVKFSSPQMIDREEGGLYREAVPGNTAPVDKVNISQGMLEQSNVQSVVEMTKMMQVARNYESTQNLMDKEDDRVRQAIRRINTAQ
jgi:flagellar basal-body rod protein FlgF